MTEPVQAAKNTTYSITLSEQAMDWLEAILLFYRQQHHPESQAKVMQFADYLFDTVKSTKNPDEKETTRSTGN
jgi:hypothetical protein